MISLATGFTANGSSHPGISLENEKFKLTFTGVFCDGRKNFVSQGLDYFYDWKPVMEIILEATEGYECIEDVAVVTEDAMAEWFQTCSGFGLLKSMLPTLKQLLLTLRVEYIRGFVG